MEVDGLVAVVTGGASGLGEAAATALAGHGARVTILDLPSPRGEVVAQELGGAFLEADVTSSDAVASALDRVVAAEGALHVAVNCAGIGMAQRTVQGSGEPHDLAVFERVIRVNLIGTFNVIRLAAVLMTGNDPNADGERGVIINTASVAAFDGQIGQAAYAASKGAVVGLTLPVARDLASAGVRSVTIAPGLFETPMLAGLPDETRQALETTIPFPRRLGRPREYAALVCQIVENPMLNGEVIRLDGALRMAPR